ncbi:MAG: putative molybdenum carrier protein [Pyrinomonadaceae bacterium]|nr:putative molybdenum carrier protein [Pyrinomonadaceae bacterium]
MTIQKIISGGQTGADRAALDFAIECGFDYGGYIPKGRRAEDGKIAERYDRLTETDSRNYETRTKLNVLNSDLTVILSCGPLTGGSLFTWASAAELKKPCLHFDFERVSASAAADKTANTIMSCKCRILNVAGPRASTSSSIYEMTKSFLILLAEKLEKKH